MRKELNRIIAFLLVICMLPLSSFPAKAVQVEEIPVEQTVPEMPEEQPVPQQPEEKEVIGEQDTKTAETIATDMADAYLDPVIREQSIGNKSVTETWVLEEDTVVDELVFSGEKIDLNGYTLTVCEDFILEKGY